MADVSGLLTCAACGAAAELSAPCCPACQAALAPTPCPACRSLIYRGEGTCGGCGASLGRALAPFPDRPGCPGCGGLLVAALLGDIAPWECRDCRGLWLTPDAFSRACEDAPRYAALLADHRGWQARRAAPEATPRPDAPPDPVAPYRAAAPRHTPSGTEADPERACPHCGARMTREVFARISGVVLDRCGPHGAWFEGDHLDRALDFVRGGGLDRLAALDEEELQKARAETVAAAASSESSDDPQGGSRFRGLYWLMGLFWLLHLIFKK